MCRSRGAGVLYREEGARRASEDCGEGGGEGLEPVDTHVLDDAALSKESGGDGLREVGRPVAQSLRDGMVEEEVEVELEQDKCQKQRMGERTHTKSLLETKLEWENMGEGRSSPYTNHAAVLRNSDLVKAGSC